MSKFLRRFLNIKFLEPSIFKLLLKDFFKINNPIRSNDFHLQKAIDWLIRAQQINNNGGVSYGYSLLYGWECSYPETSGYIIPTFLDYYHILKNNLYLNVAKEITDWLCHIQLKNGGFQGDTVEKNKPPEIFNTGQIIFGLIRAYKEFKEEQYLNCAIKAGDFLVNNQEQDGNWIKYCYKNVSHTYNVRTAWALLELFLITDKNKYQEAAIKNLKWALKQKNENYWFNNNDTVSIKRPLLHFLCYTFDGFLESGIILGDESLKQVTLNSALKLLNYYEKNGILPARFNNNWESNENYNCLTGDAQLSIIWLKLYEIYRDKNLLINAVNLNKYLKSKQLISNKFKEIDGAIKGSDPIWGDYRPYYVLNWAAKFFCDTLILESKIMAK